MRINRENTPKLHVYKWCRLMNPKEGNEYGDVVPIVHHGEIDDPRSLVIVKINNITCTRNIFDVAILNKEKKRLTNPWLRPGSTLSEVCRMLNIDIHFPYDIQVFDDLIRKGYPKLANK